MRIRIGGRKGYVVELRHERGNKPSPVVDALDYKGPKTALHPLMWGFLSRQGLFSCTDAIVAYHNDKPIGFIRWDTEDDGAHLLGTFVLPEWRGLGLATRLWEQVLRRCRGGVEVTATSRGGVGLVRKMRTLHPDREWDAYNSMRGSNISVRKPVHKAAK